MQGNLARTLIKRGRYRELLGQALLTGNVRTSARTGCARTGKRLNKRRAFLRQRADLVLGQERLERGRLWRGCSGKAEPLHKAEAIRGVYQIQSAPPGKANSHPNVALYIPCGLPQSRARPFRVSGLGVQRSRSGTARSGQLPGGCSQRRLVKQ